MSRVAPVTKFNGVKTHFDLQMKNYEWHWKNSKKYLKNFLFQ